MMNRLRDKIEAIMTGRRQPPMGPLAAVLNLSSHAYCGLQYLRASCYRQRLMSSKKLPCKVISVGNITVGGTGKTPMTHFIAERLKHCGFRVAVVSRGYKGTAFGGAAETAVIVSDGHHICADSETAGDEPFLLASRLKGVPVVIGRNRFAAGMLALDTFRSQVIVLDDGFQHMQLTRDIDLVLLDFNRPFGNRYLLPRGTLREPLGALHRGDAFIVTRSPAPLHLQAASPEPAFKASLPQAPLFVAFHTPCFHRVPAGTRCSPAELAEYAAPATRAGFEFNAEYRAVAFCGIARNDDFRQTLDSAGFNLARFFEYPDHHWYSDRDFETIQQAAEQSSARCLATTEKDFARFAHRKTWPLELIVVGVRISFGGDEERFDAFLKERLSK